MNNLKDEELNWKNKPYNNKKLIPAVRDQEDQCTCFIHCSCTCSESNRVRAAALEEPPQDFEVTFSDEQLRALYEKKHGIIGHENGKGFIRLVRIGEILKQEGAIGVDKNGKTSGPYKISSFEELSPRHLPKSTKARPKPQAKMPSRVQDLLRKGICMVGTFKLSANYLQLKPGDIYSYIREGRVMTEVGGASHAVAIIGYGIRDGEWYYVFQNSHGPNWGEEGVGRVSMNSLTRLVQLKI